MSNQKFKKTICFNKSKSAAKITTAESSAAAIRKFFVIIDSRELLNKKYSNFNNKFSIRNKLETDTNFIFDNFEIDYKIFLEKKKKKSKQFAVKYKYQFLLKENQKLQILLQNNKINIFSIQKYCIVFSKNNILKNNKLFLKKQKSTLDLKLFYLDNYYRKNFKK